MARVYERQVDPFTGGIRAELPAVSGTAAGLGRVAEALADTSRAGGRIAQAELRRLDLQGAAYDNRASAVLEADARAKLRELEESAPPGGVGVRRAFDDWYEQQRKTVLDQAPKGYDTSRLVGALDGLKLDLGDQADRFERQAHVAHQETQHKDALAARRRMVLTDPGLFDRAIEQTEAFLGTLPVPPVVAERLLAEARGELEGDRIEGLILQDPRAALADIARGSAPHLDPDRRARLWHQARAAVEREDERVLLERQRAAQASGEAAADVIFHLGLDGPAGGGAFEAFGRRVVARESGGDPAARNARSSAAGALQFVEGTWSALARKHPELGLTPEGRTGTDAASLAQQGAAFRALAADNAGALERQGVVASEANLYAAHVLGAGDALSLIAAAMETPETPVSDVLPARVVEANPALFGGSASAEVAYDRLTKGFARTTGGRRAGLGDMLAQTRSIADPLARQAAEKRVLDLHARQEKIDKEARDAASEAVFGFLEEGGRLGDIPDDAWLALDNGQRVAAEARARQLAAGIEPVTDWGAYLALEQMPASELRGYDLRQARPFLSDADFKRFADRQGEARRGGGGTIDDPASLTQQIAAAAARHGLKGEDQGLFTDRAYRAVAAEQQAKGRELDFAERQAVLDRLTLQQTTAPGWLFDTRRRGFQLGTGETAELRPAQVEEQIEELGSAVGIPPEMVRDTAELLRGLDVKVTVETLGLAAELQRRDLPVTDQNLVELWAIMRGDPAPPARPARPVPAPAVPVPAETLPASISAQGPMP